MDDLMEAQTDALIARDRCLQALVTSGDVEERLALWRAAKRYGEKARAERWGLETRVNRPQLPRLGEGLVGAGEW